jgi:hypothetical protein
MPINNSDALMLFNNLKLSIDTFYSKNSHLQESGVFNMSEIIHNCNKMEAYLNGDFESLWRMEHQDVTDLRNRLETVPVEIVHDDFDDMPPLESDVLSDVSDSMPPLVPFSTVHPLDSDTLSDVFDNMPPPVRAPSPPLKNELNTAFTKPSTSLWSWPQTYTPMSAMNFNQQIREF